MKNVGFLMTRFNYYDDKRSDCTLRIIDKEKRVVEYNHVPAQDIDVCSYMHL